MEQKRRGRPPGSKRTNAPKIELHKEQVEEEIEGTTQEKLKILAKRVIRLDNIISQEPYRMDLRLKKTETISRMCFLIEEL